VIARLVRTTVPGVFLVAAMTGVVRAQATTNLLGVPVVYPTPAPGAAKQYALPDTISSQSHPAPTPTPAPGHVAISGRVRGYDFLRFNRVQNAANPNRYALAFGATPHLDWHIGDSPFNIGYTYSGSTGFGFNGPNPIKNPRIDNSLPGYPLNQPLHELYVQYKDPTAAITVGDMELNYPWTPAADSRMSPAAYQGLDSNFAVTSAISFQLTRIIRFEQRNSSQFESNTLLTAAYPGTTLDHFHAFTPGTLLLGVNIHPSPRFVLSGQNYEFYNIANLAYVEAKYGLDPYTPQNPYIALQYVNETSDGSKQVGNVSNRTFGVQLGATVLKGLTFAVSGDTAPWQYAYVKAATLAKAESKYFVPGGGTGAAELIGPGLYKVAYGGIASPYTDSLGQGPLYTNAITQGMDDRRSAGNSYKAAFVYLPPDKQFRLIASESLCQYSNEISRNLTSEFDVDGTYYFNKVRPGPYHGFFVRVRIAPRTIPTIPYNFEYQRFQTEYDF
jgi:hypothetical protein